MQRDKRGRFIKKASGGTKIINGKQYKVKPEAAQAFATYQQTHPDATEDVWLASPEGQSYLEEVITPSLSTNSTFNNLGFKTPTFGDTPSFTFNSTYSLDPLKHKQALRQHEALGLKTTFGTPSKIKVNVVDGKYIDQYGKEVPQSELVLNSQYYDVQHFGNAPTLEELKQKVAKEEEESAGMNLTDPVAQYKNTPSVINKTKIADFLDFARAGLETSTNNKIAKRALAAEKPFLQDVSESHRAIYGDYRAQIQGEKAAAQLRNQASKPLTSDGALQQQMMMDAQIKGQQFIEQGNAQDEAAIKQSREAAWLQEKENQQQRQAAAMQNRQAILMSEKNKANILNSRDSANMSQVVSPLLAGVEKRLRTEGAQQKYYQDLYDDATVAKDTWNNFDTTLTDTQKTLRSEYLKGGATGVETYLKSDPALQESRYKEWISLQSIMNDEILRKKALIKGAIIKNTTSSLNQPNSFETQSIFKKGGTLYKAKLSKRVKDNDRTAKSIESSKKIAARLLEKAIDALYDYKDVEIVAKAGKKRKYQAGGGLPFVGHTPVFASSEIGTPKTEEKTSKGEDLTTKDVLTLLKDMDGLPSDMQVIISTLKNFEIADIMDPLGLSSSSNLATRYISLINKVKVAKFNKEEYNTALNQLKANGGLGEFAITSEGRLIGTNKDGDFEYFTPEEVAKGEHNNKGYQLLTNSNLLYLRANSLDAAFNHKLTTFAQSGIGIKEVNEYITNAISQLGTSTNSQEGYTATRNGELLQGLQDFYKAVQESNGKFDGTVNDLYKYKHLTKTQAEQAKKAMQYIYQTLPVNAKTLLKVKSDGSDTGAVKLIESLISSKLSPETTFDLDLVGGPSHKSTSSEKDDSKLKTSLPLNIQKGVGGIDSYIDIDRGDGIHMSVRGTQYNLIKSPSGEPIMDTSLATMLHKSGLQSIIKDTRNIQFGDQKISPEVLANITYNNTGITRANLPIKSDGTVNFDLLEAYEQAERELDTMSNKSPENIKQVYDKYGISDLINEDGSYKQNKFGAFIVTEGYTTDALSGLKPSDFVREYKGDEDAAVALLQKSLAVGTGKNIQVPEVDTFSWYNPADWFSWTDTIYKGVVYIPITNNVNTAVFGANQSLDYDEALKQEEKYQNFERMSNQRSTDASLLNI